MVTIFVWAANGENYITNPRVKFERYSISDGLSHLGVSSFFQDKKGFLWIGTYDGLNRFDGVNFKVFKHVPDDSTSLVNNRVRCIIEHSSGKLIIGTENGISIYDPEQEVFRAYKSGIFENESVVVLKMFEDSNQKLWVLTNRNIVYILDVETGEIHNLLSFSNNERNAVLFYDIEEDNRGYVWLATSEGLVCYHKDFKPVDVDMPQFLSTRVIRCIEKDAENNLWISFGPVVRQLLLSYSDNKIKIVFSTDFYFRIQSMVISLLADSKENIWIGSSNEGIFRLPKNNPDKIENYTYNAFHPESLSSTWISEIYEDHSGNIWFGTAEKGVNKYSYDKEIFLDIDRRSGLRSDYALNFYQYNNNKLLCGTRNGLSVFNLATERVEKAWFDESYLNDGNIQVTDILNDHDNFLWLANSKGLFFVRPGIKKQTGTIESVDNRIPNWFVVRIDEDKFGNLWVGTTTGLYHLSFDKKPEIAKLLDFNIRDDKIFDKVRVADFYIDPVDSSLWIGTWYSGLFHINIKGGEKSVNDFKIKQYQFIPGHPETLRSNFVSAILRSKKGRLWVGTEGGGFSRLEDENGAGRFVHYTEKDGLSNNAVKGILEDESGKLYISTNNKLNVFNPENETFRYYSVSDGLKSDYFNMSSALKLSDNKMVFGGNEGFTIFAPEQLDIHTITPVPEFGDFQLSYKTVHPGEKINGKVVIDKSLAYVNEINLKHSQNTFSIELVRISFDSPEDNYFRYRLKNYDQEWIYSKAANNMASYSNVAPGEYLFEFNVSSNKNEWSSNTKQLGIIISPPFWETGWAYALYIFVFLGIIITVFYFFLNMERLKSNLRIEQIEKEKEKEINKIKLRFFTNISHEFKTPVSLILGPAENLIRKFKANDSVKHNLLMIYEQANYLLRLVDQLLEFRKVEQENLRLNCVERDIVSFVRNIVKGFNSKSLEKNIKYSFHDNVGETNVWFDPAKIEMIVYNLLSNAFKFTPQGGIITVNIEKEIDFVLISVDDNGPGIPKEEKQKIFERFYQSNSTPQLHGTGIGLTLSSSLAILHHGDLTVSGEFGKGATFTLKLRLGNQHLSENEISEKQSGMLSDQPGFEHNVSLYPPENEKYDAEEKDNEHLPVLLLVEDNYQMRKYLEEVFSAYYRVITADNGNDAFSLACNKVPEIIVSDVMMPGIDGVLLVQKLKNEIITSHIPVILLTVNSELDSYIEGIETGADDYISKPFHIEHLLARIKNLLENRARLRARYNMDFRNNVNETEEQLTARDTEFIHTLYEIAEKNLDNCDFSADDFSKTVFMSRTNFYKKLKALTNQTPGEFLRLYRIKRAGEYLRSGEYSVSQVTQMVGFKSRSHFYQCFKGFYGELPTEFIHKKDQDNS